MASGIPEGHSPSPLIVYIIHFGPLRIIVSFKVLKYVY